MDFSNITYDIIKQTIPAIIGLIGVILGLTIGKKRDIKNEISKEYYKEKRSVISKALEIIYDNEKSIETLFGYYEDKNSIPVKEITKEDVFEKYLSSLATYLNVNRIYLEKDTLKKLNTLIKFYYQYSLNIKVIKSEYLKNIQLKKITVEKEKLYNHANKLFNELNEMIKYYEVDKIKGKIVN